MSFLSLDQCQGCSPSLQLPFRSLFSTDNPEKQPPLGTSQFSPDRTTLVWKGFVRPKALKELCQSSPVQSGNITSITIWASFKRDQGDAVAQELANLIRCCPALQKLELMQFKISVPTWRAHGGRVKSLEHAKWLLEAIEITCLDLKHLIFFGHWGTRADTELCSLLGTLAPRLEYLDFNRWSIGSYEAMRSFVFSGFRFASKLSDLKIHFSRISDETMVMLSRGLVSATELKTVSLEGNELSSESLPVLGRMLKHHKKLRVLHVGNQHLFHFEPSTDPNQRSSLLNSFFEALEHHNSLQEFSSPGWMHSDSFTRLFASLTRNKVLSRLFIWLTLETAKDFLAYIPNVHITHLTANAHVLNRTSYPRQNRPALQKQFRAALHNNKSLTKLTSLEGLCGDNPQDVREVHFILNRNQLLQQMIELDSVPLGVLPFWLVKIQQQLSDRTTHQEPADMIHVALNQGMIAWPL